MEKDVDEKVNEIHKEIEAVPDKIVESKTTPELEKEEEFTVMELEEDVLYTEWKKMELENLIDSGSIKEEMQIYAIVDGFIVDVFRNHPSKDVLIQYLKDQLQIKNQIRAITQQIMPLYKKQTKLQNDYRENAKDILEQIRIL